MRASEVLQKFEAANREGRVVFLNRRGTRRLTPREFRRSVYHFKNAVDLVVQHERASLPAGASTQHLVDPELSEWWHVLSELARQCAGTRRERYAAPQRVRIVIATVTGVVRDPWGYSPDDILPAWMSLHLALDGAPTRRKSSRATYHRHLLAMQRIASKHGIDDPRRLPDYDTCRVWLLAGTLRAYEPQFVLVAYRQGLKLLPADSRAAYPPLRQMCRDNERGVRTIPDIQALLAKRGCNRRLETMTVREILAVVAPQLAQELETDIKLAAPNDLSDSWVDKMVGMASRWAAALYALATTHRQIDPTSISFLKCFTTKVPAMQSAAADEVNVLLDRVLPAQAAPAALATVSLAQRIFELTARASYDNSPLRATCPTRHAAPIPPYTSILEEELANASRLIERLYSVALANRSPAVLLDVRATVAALRAHMCKHNARAYLCGQKDTAKLIETISWPQATYMGLPVLLREAYARRNAYHQALAGDASPESAVAVRVARGEYEGALLEYLVTAILLTDAMRGHNYAGALVNTHFTFDPVRDATGHIVGLTNVVFEFRGDDRSRSRLKVRIDARTGRPRRRANVLNPALVDHTLLFEYVTHVRVHTLVQLGLVATVADYALERDTWGLFVTPRAADARGRFNTPSLSDIFGCALHRMARHVLRRNVPDWNSSQLTAEWRALFCGHISRALFVSYHGGVREQWKYAAVMLNDKVHTCMRHYDEIGDLLITRKHRSSWENPRFFDHLHDFVNGDAPGRAWQPLMIDWLRYDYNNPNRAIADALRRERRRARRHRTRPAGHQHPRRRRRRPCAPERST